nr:unnamed protein product [Spirometra erinaceieuropaei]
MTFAAYQLQKKYQEMRTHIFSTFVNLTKAFDAPPLNVLNMPTVSANVPGTSRSCTAPSDPMCQQPDIIYFFSTNPASADTPVTADHTVFAPPPSTINIIRPAPTPAYTTTSTSSCSSSNTTTSHTPSNKGATSDVPPPSTITTSTLIHRCGLGSALSSLRFYLRLTHQPGRSLAYPLHRGWRTGAWSTNLHSPHQPRLTSLAQHIHPLNG